MSAGGSVGLGAATIARAVRSKTLSATAVLEEHLARLQANEPRLNALCVRLFDEARSAARSIDEQIARGDDPGPLAGVPVTIKEQFLVRGTATALGLVREKDHRAEADGPCVAALRAAGAVLVGKTNVPQLLYAWETHNPIHGRTNNPWAGARVPGGSSGGEAAVLATGGSALGLGGDFGGSVRVPSHFCGISGLRPTSHRLTTLDTRGELFGPGQDFVIGTAGPMARNVEDLDLAMSVLCGPSQRALPDVPPPLPWRGMANERVQGLKVGLVEDDGVFTPSPALRRAVREAGALLTAAGAEVVPFQPPDVLEAVRVFMGLTTADGGVGLKGALAGEAPVGLVKLVLRGATTPRLVAKAVAGVLRMRGQESMATIVSAGGALSAAELFALVQRGFGYRARFLAAMERAGIQALVTAPFGLPAFPHGAGDNLTFAGSYAFLYSLLGFPAGVVPVTTVGAAETSDRPAGRDAMFSLARECEAGTAGLPVGVQVVAQPWRDERVLALMAAIEQGARGRDGYPATPIDPAG